MFPLLTACIVFWGLLLHGVIIVKSYWDDEAKVCAIEETNSTILTVNFFYSELPLPTTKGYVAYTRQLWALTWSYSFSQVSHY